MNHKFKNYLIYIYIYIYISVKKQYHKKKKLPSCCDLIRQTRDSYHELNWVQFFFPEIYIQPKKKKTHGSIAHRTWATTMKSLGVLASL